MKKKRTLSGSPLLTAAVPAIASGQDDLSPRRKSGGAVKPLVFPLSMKVMANRPLKGRFYFYEGGSEKSGSWPTDIKKAVKMKPQKTD